MKSILPDNQFVKLRFYTPLGVDNVKLAGGTISGRFKSDPRRFYSPKEKRIAEHFVNCAQDETSILRFTERFGPLIGNVLTAERFSFPVDGWSQSQSDMRRHWKLLHRDHKLGYGTGEYMPLDGNTIEIRGKWLDFRCGDLWTFMTLEMFTDQEMLRCCERPDCDTPYFIAQHGKERYCSTGCSNWSQSQLKKRWHADQRAKRITETRTQKG